jgi:hypothetical protein
MGSAESWGLLDDLPFRESLGRFGGVLESKRSVDPFGAQALMNTQYSQLHLESREHGGLRCSNGGPKHI